VVGSMLLLAVTEHRSPVIGLAGGTPQGSFAVAGSAGRVACRYPRRRHAHRSGRLCVRRLGSQACVGGSAVRFREPRWPLLGVAERRNDSNGCPMITIEGAQPIRPYEPPISIVCTQGEPCSDANCALLTAALGVGDAAIIEYRHCGVYNMILRVGGAGQDAHYFLVDVRNVEPTDAA
jgi:hypothetical protein